jgi:hypothetical protein
VVCTLNIVPSLGPLSWSLLAEASFFVPCVSTAVVCDCTHYGCHQLLNRVTTDTPQALNQMLELSLLTPSKSPIHQLLRKVSPLMPRLTIHFHTYTCKHSKASHVCVCRSTPLRRVLFVSMCKVGSQSAIMHKSDQLRSKPPTPTLTGG